MSCLDCERRRKYMSADPEMYRGEDTRCDAHQKADAYAELLRVAKLIKQEHALKWMRHHDLLTYAIEDAERAG